MDDIKSNVPFNEKSKRISWLKMLLIKRKRFISDKILIILLNRYPFKFLIHEECSISSGRISTMRKISTLFANVISSHKFTGYYICT